MQPDPSTYLIAARQELLDIVDRGEVASATSVLVLQRIGELLAQLAVRSDDMPELALQVIPDQRRLLEATLIELKACGVSAVDMPVESNDETHASGAMAVHDDLARRQATMLRTLASIRECAPERAARRTRLFLAAARIEAHIQRAFQDRLEVRKTGESARVRTADEDQRRPPGAGEIADYLAARFSDRPRARITDVRQLVALNSKDIIFFRQAGYADWPERVVMRRLRQFKVNEQASMPYEFALLKVLRAHGLPAPRPLLLEASGGPFHQPFVMMEWLPGVQESVASLGGRGPVVGSAIAALLARTHAIDPTLATREDEPWLESHARIRRRIEGFYELWQRNQVEASSTIEYGFAWVLENIEHLERFTALVHGDCDLRNFLIDSDRVSAMLDWERSHIGHPAEDLAYCRPDIERLMPWPDFLAHYRAHGGVPAATESIRFFSIWRCLFQVASASAVHNGYRAGLHRDFLLGGVGYIEYRQQLNVLSRLLAE